jgi:hypothetical protein
MAVVAAVGNLLRRLDDLLCEVRRMLRAARQDRLTFTHWE